MLLAFLGSRDGQGPLNLDNTDKIGCERKRISRAPHHLGASSNMDADPDDPIHGGELRVGSRPIVQRLRKATLQVM